MRTPDQVIDFSEPAAALDPSARFDRLFCQQLTSLISTALRITGCRCLAEDVVQDVFIKCRERLNEQLIREPEHYLQRMVRNQAIDKIRHRAMSFRHCGAEFDDNIDAACPGGPELTVLHREQLLRIAKGLQQMPPRTQAAFRLHRLHGLTQKEIAQQLQVSTTLVNFMVRDAHQLCQQLSA